MSVTTTINDLLNSANPGDKPQEKIEQTKSITEIIEGNKQEYDAEEKTEFFNKFAIFRLFDNQILDEFIKQSIRENFRSNPKFIPSNDLILTVYSVLKAYCFDNYKHVLLKAPTGSGKTIIAFSVNFCLVNLVNKCSKVCTDANFIYKDIISSVDEKDINQVFTFSDNQIIFKDKIIKKLNEYELIKFDLAQDNDSDVKTYLLTSSKMLQEQIEKDVNERFALDVYYQMLKGVSNYECIPATKTKKEFVSYADRECLGMNLIELNSLPCFPICPYRRQREKASQSQTSVINYHYFLNVLKRPNPFFEKRDLTINDECHLLSEIVLSTFNSTLSSIHINRVLDILNTIIINFQQTVQKHDEEYVKICLKINELLNFFVNPFKEDVRDFKNSYSRIGAYLDDLKDLSVMLTNFIDNTGLVNNTFFKEILQKKLIKTVENIETQIKDLSVFYDKMKDRPDDLLIENEQVTYGYNLPNEYQHFYKYISFNNHNSGVLILYKFNVRDLSESKVSRDNYLTKVNLSLYMSATIPNMDNFATLQLGLTKEEYKAFILPSSFKYENSPIYLCNAGYLNYANFEENIHDVISSVLSLCLDVHPNERGIIHTGTFKINNLIQERVNYLSPDKRIRFLFYENAQEKQNTIKLMVSKANINYIIVGPSLYEGLDLKNDLGRFNILVKVPYSGLSTYIKAKMDRYPSWYKDDALQKIEQAIGRTDRSADDYSKTYLMDSMFSKVIFDLPQYISDRVTKRKK